MLPVIIDLADFKVAVIGGGLQAQRRLEMVDAAGASFVSVYAPDASDDMVSLAGVRLISRLPLDAEIAACNIVYIANIDDPIAERFVSVARAHKTLVNVEDVRPLCDFHVPAIVRRGDLLLTASTGGKSPGLARRMKADLEANYPPEWAERLERISREREMWRREGDNFKALIDKTNALIDKMKWLR